MFCVMAVKRQVGIKNISLINIILSNAVAWINDAKYVIKG